jgi:glyoxylase-like metal-dependent hydrolase (beta-lactamase superfamily II)
MVSVTRYGEVTRFDLARKLPGLGRYWTTSYWVDGLLIDSGCAHTAHELEAALGGVAPARIANTHSHEDHIGANGRLQRRHPGLPIQAHPLALPVLAQPRERQPLHPYRRVLFGWPEPSRGQAVADGEVIRTERFGFRVLYTPGHSPDHVCLYEPDQGWLFSGDLFVGGRDRALRAGYDIWGIIESLKRVAALPLARLFPASARVREAPMAELAAKIAYLEDLGGQVRALRDTGRSVSDIARRLCGGPLMIELFTLGNFSRRHLILSYLGLNAEPA